MRSLRDLINLVQPLTEAVDLVDDAPVEGMLSGTDLAALLPDVANVTMFSSALLKIEQGQTAALSLAEVRELANAFISLVQLPALDKTKVVQKMLPVAQTPQQQAQSITPPAGQGNTPTQGAPPAN